MENFDFNLIIALRAWAITHMPKIIIILLGMWVTIRIARFAGNRIKTASEDDDPSRQSEREKRAETLVNIMNITVKLVTLAIGTLMIVREIGIDIGPLLAGAGIIGLAVGFGSQALVKDVVTGFFILIENQFRVGDVIRAAGHDGLVEKITLRTTILRDLEGVVHIIPNGEVGTVSNLTYIWSKAVIDIGVDYRANIDRAMAIMLDEAQQMAAEDSWRKEIVEEPQMLGVQSFADSSVVLRLVFKTLPQSQWAVGREYRRRIKNRFDAEGIVIPFPQTTISFDKDSIDALRKGYLAENRQTNS